MSEPLPCGCYADDECLECSPWGDEAAAIAREDLYRRLWDHDDVEVKTS